MEGQSSDIHALEPEDFLEEVRSFQHWFEAVEGYLKDLSHGHRTDLPEEEIHEAERERLISTLCSY